MKNDDYRRNRFLKDIEGAMRNQPHSIRSHVNSEGFFCKAKLYMTEPVSGQKLEALIRIAMYFSFETSLKRSGEGIRMTFESFHHE